MPEFLIALAVVAGMVGLLVWRKRADAGEEGFEILKPVPEPTPTPPSLQVWAAWKTTTPPDKPLVTTSKDMADDWRNSGLRVRNLTVADEEG